MLGLFFRSSLLARGGLGSAACQNNTWRRINNRDHIQCTGPDTIGTMRRVARNCSLTLFPIRFRAAEEIISPEYLEVLKKLRADVRVIPWIPRTKYTEGIPGGKNTSGVTR